MRAEDLGELVVMVVASMGLTKPPCVFLSNMNETPRALQSFLDVVPGVYVARRYVVLPGEGLLAVRY